MMSPRLLLLALAALLPPAASQLIRTMNGTIQLEISGAFLTLGTGAPHTCASSTSAAPASAMATVGDVNGMLSTVVATIQPQINNVNLLVNASQSRSDSQFTSATNNLASFATNLNAEVARAGGVEGSLANSVGVERIRALLAESALNASVLGEQIRAMGVENAIAASVAAEQLRATTREANLSLDIASERLRAVAAEASLAIAAQSATTTEVIRAMAAEAALATTATSLATTALAPTINTLNASIMNEIQRALGAEAQLANHSMFNLAAEASRALAAEASIASMFATYAAASNSTIAAMSAQIASQAEQLNATIVTLQSTQQTLASVQTTLASISASASQPFATTGLFIHYDFSNTSCYPGTGIAVVDLMGTQNGQVNAAVFGGAGQARYFTFSRSATTTISMGASVPAGQSVSELTMEAWIYTNSLGSDIGGIVTSQSDALVTGASINTDGRGAVHGGGVNSYHFQVRAGGGWSTDANYGNTDANTATVNTWSHVAATREVNGQKFVYINGVASFEGSYAGNMVFTGTRWQLGQQPDALIRAYDGRIAIVRIYNRALTAAEVRANYNGQRARFGV